jgi:ubiquinone/menaquinone biosynthesis C-methylase UbiE
MKYEKDFYDQRFLQGYRDRISGIEFARRAALSHVIRRVLKAGSPKTILDFGSGNGLFADLWRSLFPNAEIFFGDISEVALAQLAEKHPDLKENCRLLKGDRAPFSSDSFDGVLSIEVMEHAGDLGLFLAEIHRVLKPNGFFLWTTPCANPFSIEHLYSRLRNQIEKTDEGYVRWTWEEPSHLRRLSSGQIRKLLTEIGFCDIGFRFRSHLFSFLCARLSEKKWLPEKVAERIMLLDYQLFRKLPNGASMIGFARKRASGIDLEPMKAPESERLNIPGPVTDDGE